METQKIISELQYKAVRSSGAGGQNVNKVSSKVVLTFDLNASDALNEEEKERIKLKLASRLTSENILILNCDEDRSQLKNKSIVTKRFLELIKNALVIQKIRKATKIPKSVIRKRIKDKKNVSEIKQNRRKPTHD
nr:alternative ribosome rescue aminoacyl-tRNA hydrolase ArfB [uncultured Flavobacterium sp.]